MIFTSGNMILGVIGACIFAVLISYVYLTWTFQYWRRIGFDHIEPSLLFGNFKELALMRLSPGDQLKSLYEALGKKRFSGVYFFQKPAIFIKDIDLVKSILVKDFDHFFNRNFHAKEHIDSWTSKMIFSTQGMAWKNMRVQLTPAFTSGRMKRMFYIFCECSEDLMDYLESKTANGKPQDVNDIMAQFTTMIIARCSFGVDTKCLTNPNDEFRVACQQIFSTSFMKSFINIGMFFCPKAIEKLRMKFIPTNIANFFVTVMNEAMSYRRSNNVVTNDFLDHFIRSIDTKSNEGHEKVENSNTKQGDKEGEDAQFDVEDYFAQAMAFFLAGFETTSLALSYTLYELALKPEIQTRLRQEIATTLGKHGGKITYEGVQEMVYLDQVVSETLRKYPPLAYVDRTCTKDYKIPNSPHTIEKGMTIFISISGIHYDPRYYPDPEKYDPERFSEDNKLSRPNCAYIPFGDGPRMCIGSRFGLLNTKTGLVYILRDFKVEVCSKTEIPIRYDPGSFLTSPNSSGIWLNIKKEKV